jgi:hypothetical protein
MATSRQGISHVGLPDCDEDVLDKFDYSVDGGACVIQEFQDLKVLASVLQVDVIEEAEVS